MFAAGLAASIAALAVAPAMARDHDFGGRDGNGHPNYSNEGDNGDYRNYGQSRGYAQNGYGQNDNYRGGDNYWRSNSNREIFRGNNGYDGNYYNPQRGYYAQPRGSYYAPRGNYYAPRVAYK